MTGFAQRLVARSAGQSAGLPFLMPRPASRFETSDPTVLDEVTETTAPAQATRPSSDLVGSRIIERPQGRPSESPGTEAPEHETGMPAQQLQSEALPPETSSVPPDQGLPIASPQPPERGNAETRHPATETHVPANITRITERSEVLADQTMARSLASVMTADEVKAERPAAPQISIGRIEVQFIAADKPVAAPRPEPQRTRGFDAYARARRGMPR
jgi:hypothetical protein